MKMIDSFSHAEINLIIKSLKNLMDPNQSWIDEFISLLSTDSTTFAVSVSAWRADFFFRSPSFKSLDCNYRFCT